MAPAKGRPATPANQKPTRAVPAPEVPAVADQPPVPPAPRRGRVPDVPTSPPRRGRGRAQDGPTPPSAAPASDEPVTAPAPRAATNDSTQLLGPDGEPVAQEAPTEQAGGDSAPPTESGQAAPEDRATTQSPGRSRALYAQRVWPD